MRMLLLSLALACGTSSGGQQPAGTDAGVAALSDSFTGASLDPSW
jgi:hypothetical protein